MSPNSADDDVRATWDYADRRAETDRDAVALVDGERSFTWDEVRQQSDRLACGLLDRVGPEDVVFEQLQNSPELYILRIACEKAGLRLLTVPRTFRENELRPLFEALSPTLAIVPGKYRGFDHVAAIDSIGGGSIETVVALDGSGDGSFDSLLAGAGEEPAEGDRIGATDVSQLATTSGSSGVPTCVEVRVGARVRTGLEQAERYGITPDDRVGVTTPLISGTPDALAYHAGAATGASVDVLGRFDPDALADRIRRGITVLLAVPTVTAKLLEHAETEGIDLSLETIVNYGDTLSPSVGRRVEERFGCHVHQSFGTADFGGITATEEGDEIEQRMQTVGRPLTGNDVILRTDDDSLNRGSGVVGDLLVDGDHRVGRPLVGEIEEVEGYFRVGVQARFDDTGRLTLLDRTKDVVIRGGRNVYPSEVENTLTGAPNVGRAAVVGVEDDMMGSRLVAFLVPAASDSDVDEEAVLRYLRDDRDFAPFKLPERIVVVDTLPMVPAGHKVDKMALRERAIDMAPSETRENLDTV